jgi:hypothetical protein
LHCTFHFKTKEQSKSSGYPLSQVLTCANKIYQRETEASLKALELKLDAKAEVAKHEALKREREEANLKAKLDAEDAHAMKKSASEPRRTSRKGPWKTPEATVGH